MSFLLELQKKLPVETVIDNERNELVYHKDKIIVVCRNKFSLVVIVDLVWGTVYSKRLWHDRRPADEQIADIFMQAVKNPWYGMFYDDPDEWSLPYIEARLSESKETFLDFAATLFLNILRPAMEFGQFTIGRSQFASEILEKIYNIAEKFGVQEQFQAMIDRLEKNYCATKELAS